MLTCAALLPRRDATDDGDGAVKQYHHREIRLVVVGIILHAIWYNKVIISKKLKKCVLIMS